MGHLLGVPRAGHVAAWVIASIDARNEVTELLHDLAASVMPPKLPREAPRAMRDTDSDHRSDLRDACHPVVRHAPDGRLHPMSGIPRSAGAEAGPFEDSSQPARDRASIDRWNPLQMLSSVRAV
jgi:hypothetical protein